MVKKKSSCQCRRCGLDPWKIPWQKRSGRYPGGVSTLQADFLPPEPPRKPLMIRIIHLLAYFSSQVTSTFFFNGILGGIANNTSRKIPWRKE